MDAEVEVLLAADDSVLSASRASPCASESCALVIALES